MDIEKLLEIIARGEGEEVEFKKSVAGVVETVCAMANTKGGYILIGIDDRGRVKGVKPEEEEKLVSHLQGLVPSPKISIKKLPLNGKVILVVKVEKSSRFISLGSVACIRVGRPNRPLDVEELAIKSVEELKVSFDALPSPAPKNMLNKKLFEEFLEKRERIRGIPIRGEFEENLRKLKVVKGDKLTIAGLLFFTDNPQEYLPYSGARIIQLSPKMETEELKEIVGPLFKLIDRVYEEVMRKVSKVVWRSGVKREALLLYPEEAIREAIINAFAHRNYRINADVRIIFKENSLVIRNPGSFPAGVDPENPEHIPRNPLICQLLYDMGYIERYGYGIIRMREAMAKHPLAEMEIFTGAMKTEVIFKSLGTNLDEVERNILLFLKQEALSSGELGKRLGLSKTTILQRLKKLETLGLVKSKGQGRSRRYFS
jgi:ATP-dependent DNA helicase RecG